MKRVLITLSIFLGGVLLFIVGAGVLLTLAPGTELFGVSYVASAIGKNAVSEAWNDYIDGDIFVETGDVPVIFNFAAYQTTKVNFVQKYSGFTTSKDRVPNASITRDADGVHVETHEVRKFFIGTNREYALTITLPRDWWQTGQHSINVNGKNADVTINVEGDNEVLKFQTLSLKGNGKVEINSAFEANSLIIETNNTFTLKDNMHPENISFKSNSAGLVLTHEIEGAVNFESSSGNLKFTKILDLVAKTQSGSVLAYGDSCTVTHSANIKTASGAVKVNAISGAIESKVVSTCGHITIDTLEAGNISSARGRISVKTVKNATIVGGTNEIRIGGVTGSVKVISEQGRVYIGETGNSVRVKNISATSTRGKIDVCNTTGVVSLSSTSGDINLSNYSSNNVTINGGGKVKATGLRGSVNVTAGRETNLAFDSFTQDVSVNGGVANSKINITINKKITEINYLLETNKGKATIYEGNDVIEQGKTLEENSNSGKKLEVSAKNAIINVYLDK